MKYLFGHKDQDSAYLVQDYPYGFRLRTQIRYWIETTKQGDRMCSQTLNPKTGLWNKPKKSTYSAVIVMVLDDNDYVKRTSFSLGWDDETKILEFVERVGGIDKFTEQQKLQIKKGIAISRTQKHITYSVVNSTAWTPEQKAAHDAEQEAIQNRIQKVFAYEYHNTKV